jgi:hypothetical protein
MEQMRVSMDHLAELAQSLLASIGVFRLGSARRAQGPALLPAAPGAPFELATQPMPAMPAMPTLNGMPGSQVSDGSIDRLDRPDDPFPSVGKGVVTTVLPRTTFPIHPSAGTTNPAASGSFVQGGMMSGPLIQRAPNSRPLGRAPVTSGPLTPPLTPRPAPASRPLQRQGVMSGPLGGTSTGYTTPSSQPPTGPQSLPLLDHLPDEG